MRTNTVYKRAYNHCLSIVAGIEAGGDLGTENALAKALGVSRTTVRAIFGAMGAAGLIALDGRRKEVLRPPSSADYFPEVETNSVRSIIEKRFMEMILHRDISPGEQINNLDLARQFSVSPSAVREYLVDFSQCGLLERRPNSSWIFRGFDLDFARELSDVRELFELESARKFADLPADSPVWAKLAFLEKQHIELLADIDGRHTEFSVLDDALHELVNSVSNNRFINNFHALRCLVFHYHYQWSKDDEKQRNIVAIQEHLTYIAALRSRNRDAIHATATAHLQTARRGLIASLERKAEGPVAPR